MDSKANVDLARSLQRRFGDLGVKSNLTSDMAVDLADIIWAARRIEKLTDELLASNDLEQVLRIAAYLEVQLFTEVKGHLTDLEAPWAILIETLDDRIEQGQTLEPVD